MARTSFITENAFFFTICIAEIKMDIYIIDVSSWVQKISFYILDTLIGYVERSHIMQNLLIHIKCNF